TYAQDQKKDAPFTRLVKADLEKLDASWEMNVDLKSGWKGTINLVISVSGPGGDLDGACRLVYWANLTNGDDRINLINTRPPGQIHAAGIKQGKVLALVSRGRQKKGDGWVLTEIRPQPDLTLPIQLDGEMLKLDMSKCAANFLPATLAALDLDFAKM